MATSSVLRVADLSPRKFCEQIERMLRCCKARGGRTFGGEGEGGGTGGEGEGGGCCGTGGERVSRTAT
eukprot:5490881-Prymnesium_polylepis.1